MSTAQERARQSVRDLMPLEGDLGFRRRCEAILEWLDPQDGELVLDCGCGYGYTLNMLSALTSARLIGLDLQAIRLTDAHQRLAERVTFVQASAQELPFATGSIPKAVCSEVLEHLPDDRAAVAELYRVLAPGGRLVTTVPASNYPAGWDPVNWALERTVHTHIHGERMFSGIWYGHRRLYTPSGLAGMLSEAGFVVEETRGLTHYVPPFSHLVVYGILKPLFMRGVLPEGVMKAGDRSGKPVKLRGPIAAVAGALNAIDRKNDDPALAAKVDSFVAIGAVVRKPLD